MRTMYCPRCSALATDRAAGFGDVTIYCSRCRWANRPYRLGSGVMFDPAEMPPYGQDVFDSNVRANGLQAARHQRDRIIAISNIKLQPHPVFAKGARFTDPVTGLLFSWYGAHGIAVYNGTHEVDHFNVGDFEKDRATRAQVRAGIKAYLERLNRQA